MLLKKFLFVTLAILLVFGALFGLSLAQAQAQDPNLPRQRPGSTSARPFSDAPESQAREPGSSSSQGFSDDADWSYRPSEQIRGAETLPGDQIPAEKKNPSASKDAPPDRRAVPIRGLIEYEYYPGRWIWIPGRYVPHGCHLDWIPGGYFWEPGYYEFSYK